MHALAPVAVSFTTGIVFDHFYHPKLSACLTLSAVSLAAWLLVFLTQRRTGLAVCYLIVGLAPLGAAYHHYRRDVGPGSVLGSLCGRQAGGCAAAGLFGRGTGQRRARAEAAAAIQAPGRGLENDLANNRLEARRRLAALRRSPPGRGARGVAGPARRR